MLTNNYIFRRISAYIADFLLVSIIVGLFSEIYIINPYYDEYIDLSNEYLKYVESVGLNEESIDLQKLNKFTYDLSYLSVYISIITLIVNVLYYVVFQYYNGGRTIGKALFNLKIKTNNGKKLKIYQLLIRYCILINLLTSLISIVVVLKLPMNSCINALSIIQTFDDTIILSCIFMIFLRKDNRGLHDLISNTSVVDNKKIIFNEKSTI